MQFSEFVERASPEFSALGLNNDLERIAGAIQRHGGLVSLLTKGDSCLDPIPLKRIPEVADLYRDFRQWKKSAQQLRTVLNQSKIQLPDNSWKFTWTPHQVEALGRAARMCPRSGHPDHDSWSQAVSAHVDLFTRCIELAMRDSIIKCELADDQSPESEEYAHLKGSRPAEEIKGFRWLAMRRGERLGILEITLQLPEEDLAGQTEAMINRLGVCAINRNKESIFNELAGDVIEPLTLSLLDIKAQREALKTAALSYQGLLESPPLKSAGILCAYVGSEKAPAGLAVLDSEGTPTHELLLKAEKGWKEKVVDFISGHDPEAAVLPASAPDTGRLRTLEECLSHLPVIRVHAAAIREAAKSIDLPGPIASAVVLGKRAINPSVEWGSLNPLSLGLGEYPKDMDRDLLLEVMEETRALVEYRKNRRPGGDVPSMPPKRRKTPAKLNPMVKTIHDLKPGMPVEGVVTNLTRFGAFVNIGLRGEAMIHISHISDDFIEDPAEALSVGQKISARILEINMQRKGIKLTMKSQNSDGRSGKPSRRGKGSSSPGRSKALSDLDKLFRK